MKKSIISVLLCFTLCLALIPATDCVKVSAAGQITRLDVTVGEPELGKPFDYNPVIDSDFGNAVSTRGTCWRRIAKADYNEMYFDWEELTEDSVAEEGYYYYIEIRIGTDANHSFIDIPSNPSYSVNGRTDDSVIYMFINTGWVYISAVFNPIGEESPVTPKEITNITATVTKPESGKTLDGSFTCTADVPEAINHCYFRWTMVAKDKYNGAATENDAWEFPGFGDTVKENYYYIPDLYIALNAGFKVTDATTGTINGIAHDSSFGKLNQKTGTNDEYSAYLTVVFDTIAASQDDDDNSNDNSNENNNPPVSNADTPVYVIVVLPASESEDKGNDNEAPSEATETENNIEDEVTGLEVPETEIPAALPETEPSETTVPETEVPAEEVPADTSETETAADISEEATVDIPEAEVPAALPKTGTIAVGLLYGIGAIGLAAGGALLRRSKHNKD